MGEYLIYISLITITVNYVVIILDENTNNQPLAMPLAFSLIGLLQDKT